MVVSLIAAAVACIAAYAYLTKKAPKPAASIEPPIVIPLTPPPAAEKPVKKEEPKIVQTPKAPEPKTEPKVEPKPVENPVDVPVVEPESVPETTPEPAQSSEPKYDVSGLFARAQKLMKERSKPAIDAHQAALKANIASFERDVKREIRRLFYDGTGYETRIINAIKGWKEKDSIIPAKASSEIGTTTYDAIVTEHLQKQTAIDDTLQQALTAQAEFYVSGLDKQIERLKKDNDTGAIALIESEIAKTKESPKYFLGLMTGAE